MPARLLHRVLPIPAGSPWEEPDWSHAVWLICWTFGKGAVVFMNWYSRKESPTGQGVPCIFVSLNTAATAFESKVHTGGKSSVLA